MNREAALRLLLTEYEREREAGQRALTARMEEAGARDVGIARLLDKRQQLFQQGLQRAFGAPQDAQAISLALAGEIERIQAELRQRLAVIGLPEDYLQPQYACPRCRDTGYVGEPVRELCSCLQQRLLTLLYREEGLAELERENFERFDEAVFPDTPGPEGPSQRAYMRRLRDLCLRYAEGYPEVPQRNLLFFGPSGLGKSFLMNCIAQRALSRGIAVMRITAYEMLSRMRAVHFGAGADQTADLFTVPLLFIDDLGTEPMLENITIVQLFTLLNERRNKEKGTVISTNFSLDELNNAYTERVTSRLLDQRHTQVLRFWGNDLRRLR